MSADTPLFPSGARVRVEGDEASAAFRVPEEYSYLEGHFPGNPIVPGVAQMGWLLGLAKRLGLGDAYSVRRYRFLKPIRPGQSVGVTVRRAGERFACEVRAEGEIVSTGAIGQGELLR